MVNDVEQNLIYEYVKNRIDNHLFLIEYDEYHKTITIGVSESWMKDTEIRLREFSKEFNEYIKSININEYIGLIEIIAGNVSLKLSLEQHFKNIGYSYYSKNSNSVYFICKNMIFRFADHEVFKEKLLKSMEERNLKYFYQVYIKSNRESMAPNIIFKIIKLIKREIEKREELVFYSVENFNIIKEINL